MNTELQTAMANFIDKLNSGVDVISENTPLVIEQFVTWNLISHWLGFISCLLLFTTTFGGPFYLHYKDKRDKVDEDDARKLLLISWVVFIPSFIGMALNASSIIKITFFTEWYLVQEASKLIN